MKSVFLVAYAVAIPALCSYALYRAARLWMWAAPILATVAGAVVVSVYLGGVPLPGEEAGMTYWTLLMPIQQLIAISICLGVLVGMRWGGSLGLAEEVKRQAQEKFSLSRLTFPHRLARIVLLEQLYRGFKICHGQTYHK